MFGSLEEPQRLKPGLPPLAAMRPDVEKTVKGTADFADWLQIKGVLAHAGLPEWGVQVRSTKPSTATADYADWLQIKSVLPHADWFGQRLVRRALVARSVLCSLFSVLRSPFSGAAQAAPSETL